MRLYLAATLLTALTALPGCCAQPSDVAPLQNNMHNVSAHVTPYRCLEPACPEAKDVVMTRARDFCAREGKPLTVLAVNTHPASVTRDGTTDVTFVCGEPVNMATAGMETAPVESPLPEGAVRVQP